MMDPISPDLLEEVCSWIQKNTALWFPRESRPILGEKLKAAAAEFGFAGAGQLARVMVSAGLSVEQLECLVGHLTVAETYFWREPRVFEELRDHVFPALLNRRDAQGKRLRIWSAGCASGEEPYSLAIALSQVLPDFQDWQITILATDINSRMLKRARRGIFRDWSFRNAPPKFRARYFQALPDNHWEIHSRFKEVVTFAYLNLAEDAFPNPVNNTNAMDVVFCRNVLMYFAPEHIRIIMERFGRVLLPDGWLVVSSSELSLPCSSVFSPVNFPGGNRAAHDRQDRDRRVSAPRQHSRQPD